MNNQRSSLIKQKQTIVIKKQTSTQPLKKILKKVRNQFILKHLTDIHTYNKKIMTDILFNEKSHVVAIFKDYLIYDDFSEFLKRFYKISESSARLPKIYEYYENCSKIFPNYINLEESKYIYKNIQRKQKMIDQQEKLEMLEEDLKNSKRKVNESKDENKIFNTDAYNSILNQTETLPNKDESFKMLNNLVHNKDIEQLGHNLQILDTVSSIEKLIDTIDDAEKIKAKENKKESIKILALESRLNRENEKYSQEGLPSPLFSQRDLKKPETLSSTIQNNTKTIKITSEIKYNKETNIEKFLPQGVENINNFKPSSELNDNKHILNNQNFLLNKTELTNKDTNTINLSSNILHKKYNEIKTNIRFASIETGNTLTLKEKIKNDSSSITNSVNIGFNSSQSRKRSVKKIRDNKQESSVKQNNEENQVLTKNHNSSSMPKLTNNIFYIINQNPQVNTQIMIYNNIEQNTRKENKNTIENNNLNSVILKQKLNTITSPMSNSQAIFKMDQKSLKNLKNLKPEIASMFNKNRNTITTSSVTKTGSTFKTNYLDHRKTSSETVSTNKSKTGTINKFLIKTTEKELRDSTPIITKQKSNFEENNKGSSAFETIQYDDNIIKNKTNSLKSARELSNSGKKKFPSTKEYSLLLSQRSNDNNHVSIIGNKLTNLKLNKNPNPILNLQNKTSIGTNANFTILNNSNMPSSTIISYNNKNQKSNLPVDMKFTLSSFKQPQFLKSNIILKEENLISNNQQYDPNLQKISTAKFNPTQGFHIKGFNEVIKEGAVQNNSHSDRTKLKNNLYKIK